MLMLLLGPGEILQIFALLIIAIVILMTIILFLKFRDYHAKTIYKEKMMKERIDSLEKRVDEIQKKI